MKGVFYGLLFSPASDMIKHASFSLPRVSVLIRYVSSVMLVDIQFLVLVSSRSSMYCT